MALKKSHTDNPHEPNIHLFTMGRSQYVFKKEKKEEKINKFTAIQSINYAKSKATNELQCPMCN